MRQSPYLTIAYTPDSDDSFYYYALETGRARLPGFWPRFECATISALNRAALRGTYDVSAVSSVIYPEIADRYAILSSGSSVGRGYGPVLVSRDCHRLDHLAGRRVGVGGLMTTGCFLLRHFCPDALAVEAPFDRIAEMIARGELDAGVMIHEELLRFPEHGLRAVTDLGALWCERYQLPLPVGLNVVRRDLGEMALHRIAAGIRHSLQYALRHRAEALAWVVGQGRAPGGPATLQFVDMFANGDTLDMPADVRSGLALLLQQVADLSGTMVPVIDLIDGRVAAPAA
jgi:1,4-dihydroxy-6-naphthoate synthase